MSQAVKNPPAVQEAQETRVRSLGLIDDYKSLHGSASAPGTSAALGTSAMSQWQPPTYNSSRIFGAHYPRPSRRGFSANHGPAWRKKYSLVNRPLGSSDPPGDGATQPPLRAGGSQGPEPQQYVLERQVQLTPDQNMIIKIKPPSKPGSASTAGVLRTSLEEYKDTPWNDHRPQEGEGEPPGGQRQPSRQGRAKGSCSSEDPVLVCQKEPGRPRVVKSMSSMSESPLEPWRTVSESAVAIKSRFLPSSLPQRGGMALGRKAGLHSVTSCVTQLRGDGSVKTSLSGPFAASGLVVGPARPAVGPRQTREPSMLASCRTNKFRKNDYKWVAASAKGPRASRRALSPRVTAENVCKAPFAAAERTEKPQLRADPDAKPRRSAMSSVPGASPSKYKWKASSPSASSASSFRWQSPPVDRRAVEPSSLQPVFSETPLSAYKVKSRTKIIRRRGTASLPGDKKSSPPPAAMAKSQFSLRRKQALRGKSSPITKKTPNKGLMPVTKHRPCCLPPGRAYLPSKEADGPSCLCRSLALNTLRPAAGGRTQTGSPRWRSRGYRCIGGVLYKVRPGGDGGGRPLLRTGRMDPAGSCSRSLASRAVQRSLAIVRQAQQRRRRRKEEYCMYYNRFGRCNRGERCPYVHDPEKVAVCTRFVRGTCKKTDGTCPFSHHVSKEKMPVCSYFLKGVCSNSNCPYSHVYVSRKAEVCTDFLRGYCPLGAKCKKKHTLLCPDFSRRGACPRGAQCQLLHRSPKRLGRRAATPTAPEPSNTPPRSRASTSHGPRKPSATLRPARRMSSPPSSMATGSISPPSSPRPEELSLQAASVSAGAGSSGLSKLPSFIALQSSPSPGGQLTARAPRSAPSKDSGKSLHIKPRL
ncbi:hypothetical protein FD755_016453 [Muntiacus reevesi]|uniref:Zinc finger CCCH domain-containing protein 3 n=1 Tax=Muntiacus reevesi TaxID=9886 RepID=A0A5N3XEH6_MUNRE|nr:hypothetical protein FD755_016453 [Muntiacus reevesi]